jgi:hypothetical protein
MNNGRGVCPRFVGGMLAKGQRARGLSPVWWGNASKSSVVFGMLALTPAS